MNIRLIKNKRYIDGRSEVNYIMQCVLLRENKIDQEKGAFQDYWH